MSDTWVRVPSPVDPLGEEDAGHERGADDEPRVRAASVAASTQLRAARQLRACRRDADRSRGVVRRKLAARARANQARLQLAQELRVLRERLGQLRPYAALGGRALRQLLEL